MKGADSIVFSRLRGGDPTHPDYDPVTDGDDIHSEIKVKTLEYVNDCSKIGYRTLVMAMKVIDDEKLKEFLD